MLSDKGYDEEAESLVLRSYRRKEKLDGSLRNDLDTTCTVHLVFHTQ